MNGKIKHFQHSFCPTKQLQSFINCKHSGVIIYIRLAITPIIMFIIIIVMIVMIVAMLPIQYHSFSILPMRGKWFSIRLAKLPLHAKLDTHEMTLIAFVFYWCYFWNQRSVEIWLNDFQMKKKVKRAENSQLIYIMCVRKMRHKFYSTWNRSL